MAKPFLKPKLTCFFTLLMAGISFSCEKDELTKPVEVSFHFKLDRATTPGSAMSFQSGNMDIESIQFSGDRDSGEDISFASDFGTVIFADLATGNTDPLIRFDIPQGTYREINLLVDPGDQRPDVIILGKYVSALPGLPVPLRIEMDIPTALRLVATSAGGSNEIILRKDSRPSVEVFLNPTLWFTEIPLVSIETAELQSIRGVPSVVISKSFNPEIYAKLASLMAVSAEAVFR
jgi:hypothetical protein